MSSEAMTKSPAVSRIVWPLGIFFALVALLGVGLTLNPREVPSPLIGKPAPAFTLPQLDAPEKTFSPADMRGQGVAPQRVGVVVRELPRGASGAGRARALGRGADLRPQL